MKRMLPHLIPWFTDYGTKWVSPILEDLKPAPRMRTWRDRPVGFKIVGPWQLKTKRPKQART